MMGEGAFKKRGLLVGDGKRVHVLLLTNKNEQEYYE